LKILKTRGPLYKKENEKRIKRKPFALMYSLCKLYYKYLIDNKVKK